MDSPMQKLPDIRTLQPKGVVVGYWIITALFCLQMSFTAYAQLRLPQVAEAFKHLGFPDHFRVELSWAKLFGVVLLDLPPEIIPSSMLVFPGVFAVGPPGA